MKVLVTGGGGFLGGAVARQLVERGHEVSSFSRGQYPELEALGVRHIAGDLADADAVARATRGCEAVVHTAAKAGVWGDPETYRQANVVGSRNVVRACQHSDVARLVYTSTPSVVHAGGDIEGGDRQLPYCEAPKTAYQATKIQAEREVLAANGPHLAVVALRPHLVWGPGDPHLVPRILARAGRGRIALPGGGHAMQDTTYIDNAAQAHVAALERLTVGASCAGRAYFVTNGEPRPLREIILRICAAGGLEPRIVAVPEAVARAAGALLEDAFRFVGTEREPPLTRFVANQLATAHWFDISDTRRDLGWDPTTPLDEGFAKLSNSLAKPPSRGRFA